MSNYDNTLRGALFVNDDKKNDRHPDYKGSLEDDTGREFWVSAWIREIQNGKNAGKPFLSLALTPKDDNQKQTREAATSSKSATDFLAQNQSKIQAHKNQLSGPAQPGPTDYDSFDDDIPF